jgi:hypothetical protein
MQAKVKYYVNIKQFQDAIEQEYKDGYRLHSFRLNHVVVVAVYER